MFFQALLCILVVEKLVGFEDAHVHELASVILYLAWQ